MIPEARHIDLAENLAGRLEVLARVPGLIDALDDELRRLAVLAERGVTHLAALGFSRSRS